MLIKLIADVKKLKLNQLHRPSLMYTRTKWCTLVKPVWDSIEERQFLSCVGQANSFAIWSSLMVNVVFVHKHLQQIEHFFIQIRCSIQHCKKHPSVYAKTSDWTLRSACPVRMILTSWCPTDDQPAYCSDAPSSSASDGNDMIDLYITMRRHCHVSN